ncbi:hypothetical protein [Ktedonobacter racemifer]|uniref:hypothetical protein n=1 Tax=Ktedonobacter racemifer TaxID=363277 RepID=UPI0012F7C9C2|nr:hypothetical protein [Ktedonobacter racemifer]
MLIYFVGHGGFAGTSHDFYLMLHRANASSLRATGLSIDALAEVLREQARQARRYLLLDCCFAAAAFRSFMGGPDQTAIEKTLDAFAVQAKSSGFPGRGTVLLCSSDQKSPSLLLPDESSTMFSHALLDVLKNGDLHRSHPMSLRDLKELSEDRLVALPEKNAPRPGLYSPDQSEGDVADVPLFPNVRAEEEQRRQTEKEKRRQVEEQARGIEEERVRKAKEKEQRRRVEEERRHQKEKVEEEKRQSIEVDSSKAILVSQLAQPANAAPLSKMAENAEPEARRLAKVTFWVMFIGYIALVAFYAIFITGAGLMSLNSSSLLFFGALLLLGVFGSFLGAYRTFRKQNKKKHDSVHRPLDN